MQHCASFFFLIKYDLFSFFFSFPSSSSSGFFSSSFKSVIYFTYLFNYFVFLLPISYNLVKYIFFPLIAWGSQEVRAVERRILLEALCNQLPPNTVRFSSKVAKIERIETGETLLELNDGTQLRAKVTFSFLFFFRTPLWTSILIRKIWK